MEKNKLEMTVKNKQEKIKWEQKKKMWRGEKNGSEVKEPLHLFIEYRVDNCMRTHSKLFLKVKAR